MPRREAVVSPRGQPSSPNSLWANSTSLPSTRLPGWKTLASRDRPKTGMVRMCATMSIASLIVTCPRARRMMVVSGKAKNAKSKPSPEAWQDAHSLVKIWDPSTAFPSSVSGKGEVASSQPALATRPANATDASGDSLRRGRTKEQERRRMMMLLSKVLIPPSPAHQRVTPL